MSALRRLSERFWFIPAVLCLIGAVLAQALVALGRNPGWLPEWFDITHVGESGSRALLTAIAGSSLAVAGTTFSITIAVLALTSSSYGPRLIHNFMTDRANQVVLGIYVATFLYSLLVLTAVQPGDDAGSTVFVPHLAVYGAVVLAVLNVAVLIFFIHHISDSIQISTIAGRVRSDLHETIDRLYPEQIHVHERHVDGDAEPEAHLEDGRPVRARRSGYITQVSLDGLVRSAQEADAVVALKVHPGRYVLDDTVLALIHPPERAAELESAVRSAVSVGDARTPWQDISFAVQQLTELAVRALSPAVNDPFTAITALDDLSSALALVARRRMPSPRHLDDTGRMRVHAPFIDVVELTSNVLDHVRWYATTSPSVMLSALTLVDRVGRQTQDPGLRRRLREQVHLLIAAFEENWRQPHDVDAVSARAAEVLDHLDANSSHGAPR